MALSVGVDVGGTKVLAVAVDPDEPSTVVCSARTPTPEHDVDALTASIARVARSVSDEVADRGHGPVASIGVGLPGLVGVDGVLRDAPNLKAGVDVPVHEDLAAALGLPVRVANDATCAAWAEVVAGAGRGAREVVLVTLGTGIGGGLVTGGRVLHGTRGFAGEPGHMVVDPSGPECPCGRRGCWERYASGSGLEWLARQAVERGEAPSLAGEGPGGPSGERLAALARTGDTAALAVFDTFAWWVGLGVANLVNLLDPELVLVGGGLVAASDLYLEQARAVAQEMAMGSSARHLRIAAATLGPSAGAIGAALLAAGSGGPSPTG